MRMKSASGVLSLLLLGAAVPAGSPMDRLPRNAAGEAVRRAIDYAGGWSAWEAKKNVAFRKTTRRFRPDGTVVSTLIQLHRYRLQPSFAARIEWEDGGHETVLLNDGRQAWKFVDGKEMASESDVNGARNSTFGSHYVFGMPFKLTDPGVRLEDAGREKFPDGTEVQKIRAIYEKGTGDAGGLHSWTYFFDVRNGRLCANHLRYGPERYEFTEYDDDRTADGIRYAARRTDYEADAAGKAGPKISEILYDDVRFDIVLPDSVFAVPPVPARVPSAGIPRARMIR
jgi:hypothetical protein